MGPRCVSGPIFYQSSPPQGALGTSKIIEIHRAVSKNQGFAICSFSRLLTPFWDSLGRLLGGFFGAQDRPNLLLEPSRADPKLYRSALGRSKSAFKTGFCAFKILWTRPWSRAGSFRTFTRPPRAPRAAPGGLQDSILGLWDF